MKPCNHEDDIARLKKRITELEADNGALMVENNDLKERVSSLVTELSVKEAQWCETEEKFKLKVCFMRRFSCLHWLSFVKPNSKYLTP